MNYRHHFHAGNFADVAKHIVVLTLLDGLQRKEKGFLFLDTHAGRGAYDLTLEARGDTLARRPEWPDGWGRIETADEVPAAVQVYRETVYAVAATAGAMAKPYPGSPLLAVARLRPQDRAVLCELQPEEQHLLALTLGGAKRQRVERRDGYEAVRGCLPPVERRALVLIDPPFEERDESERIAEALREGLRRLPGGTFAVWYPLTERAGAPAFLDAVKPGAFPPSWTAELTVGGPDCGLRMRGSGVLVVNPPWRSDEHLRPAMSWLGERLAQYPGGRGEVRWLVPE